jgi:hypothetical protein
MALLQALLALVGRSAGKILNAIFGWAVRALFGARRGAEATWLTVLVAAAALWPLLVVGALAPRAAAFALAFLPVPESVPIWVLRAVWIALVLLVPLALGLALAAKQPADAPREPFGLRAVRGVPVTLAVALAFWMSFVSVPLRRLASMARRLEESHVPLITTGDAYADAADEIARVLDEQGFGVRRTRPSFWMRAPLDVMRALGGKALRGWVPESLAHFAGPELAATLHPSSLLLRGREDRISLAHGVIVEALAACDAFQTTDPDAQDLERQIRRLWRVLRRHPAHEASAVLSARVDDVARQLTGVRIAYDDWEIVYRQLLQLSRALRGEPPLLGHRTEGEKVMRGASDTHRTPAQLRSASDAAELPTGALLREIASKATLLAAKEVELARLEMKRDLDAVVASAKSLAVAAVCAICALNLLLVAGVLAAAAQGVEGWIAAAVAAAAMLAIAALAALIGWRKRPLRPLERTRRSLKEDIRWATEAAA